MTKINKIVVTGGAGFIGSNLLKRIYNESKEIIVIDNFTNGSSNMLDKIQYPNIIYKNLDILNDEIPESIFHGAETLYHLAASKHSSNSGIEENIILRTNINSTYNLFEKAAKNGVKNIIFTSSLYSYGSYSLPAMKESDLPKPNTVYGISKLSGEHLLKNICKEYKIKATILRLFFVYGPGINKWNNNFSNGYKSVIVKHFERIKLNKSPIIFGSGKQSLDYVNIEDVVSALVKAPLWSSSEVPIYNIGSGKSISVNEVTRIICNQTKFNGKLEHSEPDETEGTIRISDISSVIANTDWKPEVSFDKGIEKIHKWIFNND